jgi:hypothetical protein
MTRTVEGVVARPSWPPMELVAPFDFWSKVCWTGYRAFLDERWLNDALLDASRREFNWRFDAETPR